VFGHDCIYLSARRGDSIVGVLPLVRYRSVLFGRFLVSLPYCNYAGILADDPEVVSELVDCATRLAREHRAKHIELRHRDAIIGHVPVKTGKLGFSRPLPSSVDALWASLDRKLRNQVRKAQNNGLKVSTGGGELIQDFYRVFAENMRDLGSPAFPQRLFSETASVFQDRFRAFVVYRSSDPVAAGITLRFRDTLLLPWASSLRQFNPLCGNVLLYWSMAEWAVNAGVQVLDLGRSSENTGPQRYKEQWGAVGRPLHTEYVPIIGQPRTDNDRGNARLSGLIRLWQRLPVPLATRLGSLVIKHVS
jgi:FemAB-related protein (PEP-CTERM system-associated)